MVHGYDEWKIGQDVKEEMRHWEEVWVKLKSSPINTLKLISEFTLKPLTLSWFIFHPEILETGWSAPLSPFDPVFIARSMVFSYMPTQ